MRLLLLLVTSCALSLATGSLTCDFASGMDTFCNGAWETSGGDFTWTRRTGSTPSGSTGPSSGPLGAAYVHLEASDPNYPSKTAYLTSLSGQFSGIMFKYHMYGATVRSLAVEVKALADSPWSQVWIRSGQQHTAGSAAWSDGQAAFPATARQVRFVGTTGTGWTGDAAVTDVILLREWNYCPGFISAGGDLPGYGGILMTPLEAQLTCSRDATCYGYTWTGSLAMAVTTTVWAKTKWDCGPQTGAAGWHAYQKPATTTPSSTPTPLPTETATTALTATPMPTATSSPSANGTTATPMPTATSSPSANGTTVGVPAVAITGACIHALNTVFVPQAVTASGRWWYESSAGHKLYWDQDCSGQGDPSRWILNSPSSSVSTTAFNDLDGDGICSFWLYIDSTALLPPSGTWSAYCDGAWTYRFLFLSSSTIAGTSFTTPAVLGLRNHWNGEVGYAFTLTAGITVAALGRGPALQTDVQVNLWSSATQAAIAKQTVGPSSPGFAIDGFWFVELAAPVQLLPGVEYVITQSCTSGMIDKWDDASHPGTISDTKLSAKVTGASSGQRGGYPTSRDGEWRRTGMVSFLYTATTTPSSTATPKPIGTPLPTETAAVVPTATPTPTPTATSSPSANGTTATPTPTATSSPSANGTTATPTPTATSSPSANGTTATPTSTATSSPSATGTTATPTSTATSSPSATGTTVGVSAVAITGACIHALNTVFVPQAVTASGRWWYESSAGHKLYWDQDCSGQGDPSRWILNSPSSSVSTTAFNDLDGDGICSFWLYIGSTAQLPPSGTWSAYCDDTWTQRSLVVSPRACLWIPHPDKYSVHLVGGVSTFFDRAGAEQNCVELGSAVCKAVTCTSSGICTVRASSSLSISGTGETTHVPSPECYVTCPAASPPTGTTCTNCTNTYQGTNAYQCSCSCNAGYTGSPSATCSSTGQWSYVGCTAGHWENVSVTALHRFVEHQGYQCWGSGEDSLRSWEGSAEECAAKCLELGVQCSGFIRVHNGVYSGNCFFRTGVLSTPSVYYADNRDCYSPRRQVRLVGGADAFSGRVEVLHNGQWGTVCDDDWGASDASVVCRSLGYPGGQAHRRAHFGQGSGQIWLDHVACTGSEMSLDACGHAGWGVVNCGHHEDAGVTCQGDLLNVNKAAFRSGEDIVVTFSRSSGATERDWIGIYPKSVETPDGSQQSTLWFYACHSKTTCSSPVANAQITFGPATPGGTWPLAAGNYHVWYFHNDGHSPVPTTPSSPIAFTVGSYIQTPDAAIPGYSQEQVMGTVSDCVAACDARAWCKSFDYYKASSKCDLSTVRAADVGGLQTDFPGNPYDYYEKPDQGRGSLTFSQLGNDIDGEAAGDWRRISLSLSTNGNRLAIGAYGSLATGTDAGHTRVYGYINEAWAQIGADIDGEAAGDGSGTSVSLSADGKRLAIGAYRNDGTGTDAGHTRVYEYINRAWAQIGADIDGEAAGDGSGNSLSLSADGTRLAIGAYRNDGTGTDAGHTRVYEYINRAWAQIGADIDGEAAGDWSGYSVSLSADGTRLAIGAYRNDVTGTDAGHTRVYEYINRAWAQIGADIDGEAAGDWSGYSVSLSADGKRLAIGAYRNDVTGTDAGHTRVYEYINRAWAQIGADIDGEAAGDWSGYSVSLSADGTRLAIGAYRNDVTGTDAGHTRVYEYINRAWAQIGADIDGEAAGDWSGYSVSLSADGTRLAIGAYRNDVTGTDAGHTRVYRIESTCTDALRSGDETGIDCGGSCPACAVYEVHGAGSAGCPGSAVYLNEYAANRTATNTLHGCAEECFADVRCSAFQLGIDGDVGRCSTNREVFCDDDPLWQYYSLTRGQCRARMEHAQLADFTSLTAMRSAGWTMSGFDVLQHGQAFQGHCHGSCAASMQVTLKGTGWLSIAVENRQDPNATDSYVRVLRNGGVIARLAAAERARLEVSFEHGDTLRMEETRGVLGLNALTVACRAQVCHFTPSKRSNTTAAATTFCNGLWSTSGGDFTWTRQTQGTPPGPTGPSTGPYGRPYVYLDASSPNHPFKTAYLTSSPAVYSRIHFKYHMYGAAMGSLAVQTQDASGAWAEVWARSGQQHGARDARWVAADVVFARPVQRVRFVGVTGAGYQSAAALADVEFVSAGVGPGGSCGAPQKAHMDFIDCRGHWDLQDACTPTCQKGYTGAPTLGCTSGGSWLHGGSCAPGPQGSGPSTSADNFTCGAAKDLHCPPARPCCSRHGECGSDAAACGSGCNPTYSHGATCDVVSCGPPVGLRHVDTSLCQQAVGTTCHLRCLPGFVGAPTAVCARDGVWTYGGSCEPLCVEGFRDARSVAQDRTRPLNGPNASCWECARACASDASCLAYECTPAKSQCRLHADTPGAMSDPPGPPDAVLCQRDSPCAAGFFLQTGTSSGTPAGGNLTCGACAARCDGAASCAAYECSSALPGRCDLHPSASPASPVAVPGRLFCAKGRRPWGHVDGGTWYVNLPHGNFVAHHSLDSNASTTAWTRLRVRGAVTRGMREIYVVLSGHTPSPDTDGSRGASAPTFGTAGECRAEVGATPAVGTYAIDLSGTPFVLGRLPPAHASGGAGKGGSRCYDKGKSCMGSCTGTLSADMCVVCGLGQLGMDGAFPLRVADPQWFDAALPALSTANAGCWTLHSEALCLGSRDGRAGQSFFGQRCEWCCGVACTPNGHKCEPRDWLLAQPGYTGRSRDSLGGNSCAVDCGPPSRPHTSFAGCEHTHGGACGPRCLPGYTGHPTAVCSRNGFWRYGGSCVACTDEYWEDVVGHTCHNYTANQWCTASGAYGPGWAPDWGRFRDYAVDGRDATEVCCGCGALRQLGRCDHVVEVPVGASAAASKRIPRVQGVHSCPAVCGPGCYDDVDASDAEAVLLVTFDAAWMAVDRVDARTPWTAQLSLPCCAICAPGFQHRVGGLADGVQISGTREPVPVASCNDCAALCLQEEECRAYVCSGVDRACRLSVAPSPTAAQVGEYMFCARGECGVPTVADNMMVSNCSDRYGGSCEVTCRSGYVGSPTAECGIDGTWRYAGSCSAVSCGAPRQPNVDFTGCPQAFGGTCKPSCRPFHSGHVTAVCSSDGSWTYEGSCTRISCGAPHQANVDFQDCSFEWGGACNPVCLSGYVGSPAAQCHGDGLWRYQGSCQPEIPTYENSEVFPIPAARSTRSIIKGEHLAFDMLAVRVKTARVPLASLTVSLEAPDGTHVAVLGGLEGCNGTELDATFAATAGVVLGPGGCANADQGLQVRPTAGDTLDSIQSPQPAGYWILTVASTNVFHPGLLHLWSFTATTSALQQPCPPGFQHHVGGLADGAQISGTREPVPVASCNDCAALCLQEEECRAYVCSGVDRACRLSVAPSPTAAQVGEYMFCARGECGVPTVADNMMVSNCSDRYGGSCEVTCRSGYVGSPTAECGIDGTWRYAGSCSAVSCGAPRQPNVDFTGCPQAFGGTCKPSCRPFHSGHVTAVCSSDGSWTYEGSCTRISCGAPHQANVDFQDCSFEWGGSCNPVCLSGYVGSPAAQCHGDGLWRYQGSCQPEIPTYENSEVFPIPAARSTRSIIKGEHLAFDMLAVRVKTARVPLASLTVSLEAPDGTHVAVLGGLEGCNGTQLDATFAATAGVVLGPGGCANADQGLQVRPTAGDTLDSIQSPQPAGYWILTVASTNPVHPGLLQFWSLSTTAPRPSGLEVYVFGAAQHGQSGLASDVPVSLPSALEAPNNARISHFAVGGRHTILVAGGHVYGLGSNEYGQLGLGHTDSCVKPEPLPFPDGEAVTAVACGRDHSAFIAGAVLWVFGKNEDGQLGLGHAMNQFSPQPLAAPNGRPIDAVACGGEHSAFIAGGALWLFGRNEYGQLGLADNAPHFVPGRLVAPNGRPVSSVALGHGHSAIIAAGALYVFGRNSHGQLGLNDTTDRFTPQRLEAPNGAPVEVSALGGDHSAFLAGGSLYVVGRNDDGQLGLGAHVARTSSSSPILLPLPSRHAVDAVSLGARHSAVLAGGYLYTCGSNLYGQLGVGDYVDKATLQLVKSPGGRKITDVALGQAHTMFLSHGVGTTFSPSGTASSTPLPTATCTGTPTPTCSATPSPTATVSPTPTPSGAGTITATPTTTCTPTPTDSTTPTPAITTSLTPSGTVTMSGSASTAPTDTNSETPTQSNTLSHIVTCSASRTLTCTPTATSAPSPTPSPTCSTTSSGCLSLSTTPTPTTTAAHTPSNSHSVTPTPTVSRTSMLTMSTTSTPSITPSWTNALTMTSTRTPSKSIMSTDSSTESLSATATCSPTSSNTATPTPTTTSSCTPSHTLSSTAWQTATNTPTATPSTTSSSTPKATGTCTPTTTTTLTHTHSYTHTVTPALTWTTTPSYGATLSLSVSQSPTLSSPPSLTLTPTPSHTISPPASNTPTSSPVTTLSCTPSDTSSQSGTTTPTTSRLFTPTPTPSTTISKSSSSTLTPSRLFTCTSSPSTTISQSASNTPTPSRVFTVTPIMSNTASQSNTPTASRLFTLTSTPSNTISPSASNSQTASHIFTPTCTTSNTITLPPSPSPTPSHLFTATSTASNTVSHSPSTTPTTSRLFTPTPTPSTTISESPSSTLTPSRLFTCTSSPSTTISQSASNTPTPSRVFTFTPTMSNTASLAASTTPTASRLFTLTSTPSNTIPPSASDTPTSSRLFTPSATLSASYTPTPSRQSTLSATTSETATCSAAATPTNSLTHTPFLTSTQSLTSSYTASTTATLLPTSTPSPTPTVELPQCSAQTPSNQNGVSTLQVTESGKCLQSVGLGQMGATLWKSKSIAIRILALREGTAIVRLSAGCRAHGKGCPACDACQWRFTAPDVGRMVHLPLGSASDVKLLLFYEPPATNRRRLPGPEAGRPRAGDVFQAEVVVYYAASSLVVLLLALSTLLVVPCCIGLSRRHAKSIVLRPIPMETFAKRQTRPSLVPTLVHPRWPNPWIQVGITLGLYLLLVGALWTAVLSLLRHPAAPLPAGVPAGLGIAALGLLLLTGFGLWGLRDDETATCPVCCGPVSRWVFLGTQLPPPPERPLQRRKGHTRCLRCLGCRQPVVTGAWADAPSHRSWHAKCWAAHCARARSDTQYARLWGQDPAVVDLERAFTLAAAVEEGLPGRAAALLPLWPDLYAHPLPGRLSPLHCAARAGALEALQMMLPVDPECLDQCCVAVEAEHSLQISGLPSDKNDVYVLQPPLAFNARPVYVGHTTGHYVYYYEPAPGAPGAALGAGWCVSGVLGSGAPPFRLLLDREPDNATATDAGAARPVSRCRTFWQRLRRILGGLVAKCPPTAAPDAPATHPEGMLIQSLSNTTQSDTTVGPAANGPTVGPVANATTGGPAGPLTPEEVGLRWIPRTVSLLEAAVASGEEAVVRYALQAYQDRYPQCLQWARHTGHGLWQAYPPATQTQIAQSLARGERGLVTRHGHERVHLDFAARLHRTPGGAEPMRCSLQTMFQHRTGPGGWGVTSNPGAVPDWTAAFVLLGAGSLAVAAPRPETLRLLHRHGAVDPSLWHPPCAAEGAQSLAMDSVREEWFVEVLGDVIAAATNLPGGGPQAAFRSVKGPSDRARRFTDGLMAPTDAGDTSPFYDEGYRADTSTLAFCLALGDNELGLLFNEAAIAIMVRDCVMKVHELGRQRVSLSPVHAVPLYVYTYELSDESVQIYGAMNSAMRTHDKHAIAFWRPLIWQVDQALQQLPPYHGKLYRGISLKFNEQIYKRGGAVCWPAFSSASATRAVAEEFVKGDDGTLFFLQSCGARAISKFSKFPDEDEVLFRPNTVFEISSTLYGNSDIGAFYASVDNIAMTELSGPAAVTKFKAVAFCNASSGAPTTLPSFSFDPARAAAPAPYDSCIIVSLPPSLFTTFLTLLSNAPQGRVDALETSVDDKGRCIGHMLVAPNLDCTPIELPDVCRLWGACTHAFNPPNSPAPHSPLFEPDPLPPPLSLELACSLQSSPRSRPGSVSSQSSLVLSPKFQGPNLV